MDIIDQLHGRVHADFQLAVHHLYDSITRWGQSLLQIVIGHYEGDALGGTNLQTTLAVDLIIEADVASPVIEHLFHLLTYGIQAVLAEVGEDFVLLHIDLWNVNAKDVFDMIKHSLRNHLLLNCPSFDVIFEPDIQYRGKIKY